MERVDCGLNTNGIKQAEKAASVLKDNKIKFIITSPLKRAIESSAIIQESLNCPLITVSELKEMDLRELEGKQLSSNVLKSISKLLVENTETNYNFKKRVISATNKCLVYEANVLIVSHAIFWYQLTKVLFGYSININNGMPYFVRAPEKPSNLWFTYPLLENELDL
jgi:broad specificity phosphatase PhoE